MAKAAADKIANAANKPMTMIEQVNAAREKMKAKAEERAKADLLKAPVEKKERNRSVSPQVKLSAPKERAPLAKKPEAVVGNMFL